MATDKNNPLRPVGSRSREKKNRDNSTRIIGAFVGTVALGLVLLVLFSSRGTLEVDTSTRSFFTLHEVYVQQGMQRFLEEKNNLKTRVESELRNPSSEDEENFASNVATYLFPEVLPDNNFEKQVALDQWIPQELAIENAPRTQESRLQFEEMRASLWNYENPDRVLPQLSPYAKEVLRIYDAISEP